MRRERITYKEELPVNVLVAEMKDYPIHFHEDYEIIYVLEGKIILRCGAYTYHLRAGDIFVINANELHSIKTASKNNMVLLLHLSSAYFGEYYDELKDSFFMIDPEKEVPKECKIATRLVGRIMLEIIEKGSGYQEKVIETAHNLISVLLYYFKYTVTEDGRLAGGIIKNDRVLAGRLFKIVNRICREYSERLTLNGIAESENLSIYYLSHIIKDGVGLSFQELLNYIRVEESELLLKHTQKKVSVIAAETGFSAVRYYTKHFELWYGMLPMEYKRQYGENGRPQVHEAKYVKSDVSVIENALKKHHSELYREYLTLKKCLPIIVNVDLSAEFSAESRERFAEKLMDKGELTKPLARPYKLLKSLREHVREIGINFIVTADTEIGECDRSMSVLVYNFNEEMCNDFCSATSREQILEKIDLYNEPGEFLVRITGLYGTFRISRYKLSSENIRCAYEEAINQGHKNIYAGKRQAIVSNWSTLPDISFDDIFTMGSLSLCSTLQGVSGELIFIDRI